MFLVAYCDQMYVHLLMTLYCLYMFLNAIILSSPSNVTRTLLNTLIF